MMSCHREVHHSSAIIGLGAASQTLSKINDVKATDVKDEATMDDRTGHTHSPVQRSLQAGCMDGSARLITLTTVCDKRGWRSHQVIIPASGRASRQTTRYSRAVTSTRPSSLIYYPRPFTCHRIPVQSELYQEWLCDERKCVATTFTVQ